MKQTTPGQAFSIPSEVEAEQAESKEFDHLGRRRIIHPEDVGKESPRRLGYTRTTTFIKAIDDRTQLEKWRIQKILEGADLVGLEARVAMALNNRLIDEGDGSDPKAVENAVKDYRRELNTIADEAFVAGGGADAANYGTALHSLVEDYHNALPESWALPRLAEAESAWPGITEDFEAYKRTFRVFVEATGAKVILSEPMVVNDALRVSGRTDLILLAKLPGDIRARRVIWDLKSSQNTDRPLALCQQLAMYAGSKLYDAQTGERSPLRVRQDVGIIAHAPKGQGRCDLLMVDLAAGRRANALCGQIRAARRKQPGIITALVEVPHA